MEAKPNEQVQNACREPGDPDGPMVVMLPHRYADQAPKVLEKVLLFSPARPDRLVLARLLPGGWRYSSDTIREQGREPDQCVAMTRWKLNGGQELPVQGDHVWISTDGLLQGLRALGQLELAEEVASC